MTTEDALQQAAEALAPWTVATTTPAANHLTVQIAPENLLPALTALRTLRWGYLAAITGVDLGPAAGQIEVLYHCCHGAAVVTLRVRTPRDDPRVPSVCGIIPSATLYERELIEMLGVTVEGTPNSARLFLPDDWPDGVYPLRKDFVPREIEARPVTS